MSNWNEDSYGIADQEEEETRLDYIIDLEMFSLAFADGFWEEPLMLKDLMVFLLMTRRLANFSTNLCIVPKHLHDLKTACHAKSAPLSAKDKVVCCLLLSQ